MAKLIALRSILYQNHVYDGGDELPYYSKDMVNAWLEAGSAKYITEKSEVTAEDNSSAVAETEQKKPRRKGASKK